MKGNNKGTAGTVETESAMDKLKWFLAPFHLLHFAGEKVEAQEI